MPDPERATDPQLIALGAIAAGRVDRYFPWSSKRGPSWRCEPGVRIRSDVITKVVSKGWARVGPRKDALRSPVELTETGREVLNRG